MREGWKDDSYLIVFDEDEVARISEGYGIADYLPGYRVVAIRGWDDFVIENRMGERFTVPTIPLDAKYIRRLDCVDRCAHLDPDDRYVGKIKWYIQPVIFGGDPNVGDNMTWVDLTTHQEAVRWWNQKFREVKPR